MIAANREAMLGALDDDELLTPLWSAPPDFLNLPHSRYRESHILVANRDAQREFHFLEVCGDAQPAWVRGEAGVDEWGVVLVVGGRRGGMAEERDVFTTPAEAGGAEREGAGFVCTH